MDGCEVVVYHGIMTPQVFIEVHDVNYESVLRGRECQQLVPVAKVLEHLLLTLVNSACVVLEPFVELGPGSVVNMGEQNLKHWRP